jgi:hypothetical protein
MLGKPIGMRLSAFRVLRTDVARAISEHPAPIRVIGALVISLAESVTPVPVEQGDSPIRSRYRLADLVRIAPGYLYAVPPTRLLVLALATAVAAVLLVGAGLAGPGIRWPWLLPGLAALASASLVFRTLRVLARHPRPPPPTPAESVG